MLLDERPPRPFHPCSGLFASQDATGALPHSDDMAPAGEPSGAAPVWSGHLARGPPAWDGQTGQRRPFYNKFVADVGASIGPHPSHLMVANMDSAAGHAPGPQLLSCHVMYINIYGFTASTSSQGGSLKDANHCAIMQNVGQ